jgi:pimeloyl-ACP methyl ester carboxylesterase
VPTPLVLVPGFWLGGWAWDEVASLLRADGHDVTALTLPGLESADADRSTVTLEDHVEAIRAAVEAAPAPVVLAVHSGAAIPGYAATDRIPERIAAMVYADSGPETGPVNADFEGAEWPLPSWDDLDENLDGISEEQLAEWRRRAVPEPAAALRQAVELRNEARFDVPTTILCTAFSCEQVQAYLDENPGWLPDLKRLREVDWVDLPTSHWPMWSRPRELAELLGRVASARG